MTNEECQDFIAVTSWLGRPQEVVTLYFYENAEDARRIYKRMCNLDDGTVRLCKVIDVKECSMPEGRFPSEG